MLFPTSILRLPNTLDETPLVALQNFPASRHYSQGSGHRHGVKALTRGLFDQLLLVDHTSTHRQPALEKAFDTLHFFAILSRTTARHFGILVGRTGRHGTDFEQTHGFRDILAPDMIIQAHLGQGFRNADQGLELTDRNGNGSLAFRALTHFVPNLDVGTRQDTAGFFRQTRTAATSAVLNVLPQTGHIQFTQARRRNLGNILRNGFGRGFRRTAEETKQVL